MNKVLLGRDKEVGILEQLLASDSAEFLALYGRRRVGKTFLIRQFFKPKEVVFFNVTGAKKAPMKEQIKHFTKELGNAFYHGADLTVKKNWDDTFGTLTQAIDKSPVDRQIVLFFDEFPWMATRNSRLLENLDYYWNQYWSNDNRVKLIVCGSSASWIIKKIVKNKAGLHNRITKKIRLEPFNLPETKTFLHAKGVALNNRQIARLYMIMGGIPYYLMQIQKGLSASQIIENLAFSKEGFLFDEFENLFPALFDNYEVYVDILRIIASSRQGVGKRELLLQLGKSQNGAQGIKKLSELEEAGFIKRFKPRFNKKKGVFYRLIDEYTAFYFTWIEPVKETLQEDSLEKEYWQSLQISPKWSSWLGYSFETLCYKHIGIIRKKLSISPASIASAWRYVPKSRENASGAQIDLLFDRLDDAVTLCEIKYSDKPYVVDKAYAKNLLNKRDVFAKQTRTKKQLFIAMIAANGIQDNLYSDDLISGVVTLDDFFQ